MAQLRALSAVLAVAMLSVVIRLPYLHAPMVNDEAAYAYTAYFWREGDALYEEVLLFRPQGMIVLYRVIISTFGENIADIRLFLALYNAITVVCVYLAARFFVSAPYALLAALLYGVFSTSSGVEGFLANAEPFVNLPATLSALALLRSRVVEARPSCRYLLLAGLFAGLSAQIKPSGVAVLLLGGMATLFLLRHQKGYSAVFLLLGSVGSLVLGFTLSLIPALVHGYLLGWDTFIEAALGFSVANASPFSQSLTTTFIKFAQSLAIFINHTSLIFAILIARRVAPRTEPVAETEAFLWMWLLSTGLGIAAGGSWWMHYYILALPPLCILASLTFKQVVVPILQQDLSSRRISAAGSMVSVTLAAALIYSGVLLSRPYPPIWFSEAADVAKYLAERTEPDERILVTDSGVQVYYLARRRAAFPYLFLGEAELRRLPQMTTQLAHLLEDPAQRPPYVVIPNSESGPTFGMRRFYQALDQYYTPEARYGAAVIYKRASS